MQLKHCSLASQHSADFYVTECTEHGFQLMVPYRIIFSIALLKGFFPVHASLDSYISKSSQCAVANAQRKPIYIKGWQACLVEKK